ncbi:MAG: hypothetical protein ACREDP_16200 [Bradyrhizobium sp.]
MAAFSRTGIETHSGEFRRQHLAMLRPGSQQPIVNNIGWKIRFIYQLVELGLDAAANLAAFTSACPLLVAALRGACHPIKSVPAKPKRNSGTGFLAAEMKEYDA